MTNRAGFQSCAQLMTPIRTDVTVSRQLWVSQLL